MFIYIFIKFVLLRIYKVMFFSKLFSNFFLILCFLYFLIIFILIIRLCTCYIRNY